jgi:hypothetical protein
MPQFGLKLKALNRSLVKKVSTITSKGDMHYGDQLQNSPETDGAKLVRG